MRLFVYEYLCAGGPGVGSLRAEGRAMLAAVLHDLARCPDVQTTTLLDPSLLPPTRDWPDRVRIQSAPAGAEEAAFRALARAADFSLVIAPESGGLLARRCRWVEEEDGRLLGPSSAAVRLTADKLELARYLLARGVPTPPAAPLTAAALFAFPLVCKPRDGAGSQDTFLVRDERELREAARSPGEMIVQPYVPGLAASVAFLVGPGQAVALPAAEQTLSADGRFRYKGGRLPLPEALDRRARELAAAAVRAVEGLRGYVGVDLVLGEPADGSGDRVIEINPRLTTSYVGLRVLAKFNLAAALLAVATGSRPPAIAWRDGTVHFSADGVAGVIP